ncbi:uncharacterized protein LOC106093189 [Stomoxys calcitrans]|uniref:uncharacterized protein LOC106093189 n=1 Tax=Stomoxys calcitrans TaxID=35570 RepID=UPI0027E2B46E|nr:uncharacterized protein LOC106093189 [Stomoxys calcitrans]
MKILRIIQGKHIDKIFLNSPVGDQALFEHRLAIWKQQILLEDFPSNSNSNSSSSNCIKTSATDKPEQEVEPKTELNIKDIPLIIDNSSNDSPQVTEIYVANESNDALEDDLLELMEPTSRSFNISSPVQIKSYRTLGRSSHSMAPLPRASHAASVPSSVPSSMPSSAPSGIFSSAAATVPTSTFAQNLANSIILTPPPMPLDAVRVTLPTQQNPAHVRYSLSRILNETSGGQVIMNYYEKHKILREEHRTALINVIARYIDANGCTLSLSESNNLENQIVEMFPTEREEFYRTSKRGRLYNKIANMKRVYKKFKRDAEIMPSASNPNSPGSGRIKEEFVEELDDAMIQDMRSGIQSSEDFMEFWKRTQSARLKDIDTIDTLTNILEKWPEYKQTNAEQYMGMDFVAKFPSATRFSDVFYTNYSKLEKMLFAKVSTCSVGYKHLQVYRTCSTESKHLIMLWVLHQLFPPNHQTKVDEMGIKRKKRYSIQDSQNSCICVRGSRTGIESMLRMRTTATPPMILAIGEMGGEIEEVSVYFEGLQYPCNSVVQAAQLCCELFFLFNIDFPEESVLYYNFIQTFFLNILPEIKNSKIYTTINEINACEM